MLKHLHILSMALLMASITQAQAQQQWCATDAFYDNESKKHPDAYQKAEAEFNQSIIDYESGALKKDDHRTYYIPVVFHYFHNEESPERFFGQEQVAGVLKRLNEDFNASNPDVDQIQDYYKEIRGNANIQFLLAEKEPNGSSHTGINYIKTLKTNASQRTIDSEVKYLSHWPSDKYLNFWIVESLAEPGVLAFATLPEFVASGMTRKSEDGIMGLQSLFRTTLGIPFERHALSHEVGHWLGLRHPFQGDKGDADGCSQVPCRLGGDFICDIPQVDRPRNNECTQDEATCPPDPAYPDRPDNITNFMDYRSCPQMFSKEQVQRMRGTLLGHRNSVVSWQNLKTTGIDYHVKQSLVQTDMYPNPFSSQLSLTIQLEREEATTVSIKDLLGKTLYEQSAVLNEGVNHVELSANAMKLPTAGIYLLAIQLEGTTLVKRIQYTPSK